MRRLLRVVVGATLMATAACAHHRPETGARPTGPTTVRVDNQNFLDMTIYVLASGQRVRLGLATGKSTNTFTIPAFMIMGPTSLRFRAEPVGGRGSPVSEEITVLPGDEVTLTIPAVP